MSSTMCCVMPLPVLETFDCPQRLTTPSLPSLEMRSLMNRDEDILTEHEHFDIIQHQQI